MYDATSKAIDNAFHINIARVSREYEYRYSDLIDRFNIELYRGIGTEAVSMNTYAEHLTFVVPNIYGMIDDEIKEALLHVRI